MKGLIDDTTYRATVEERASRTVIRAVASAENVDPIDLETPLHAAVDPDALDTLFRPGTDCRVQFTYSGYEVTVHDDGRVVLEPER